VSDTSGRLLRLLSLLQAHRDWTGADLAERLHVTTRTIRSDVGRLRRLGYPVHASPGVAGGYRLGAGAELPPLLLDDEEAVAVVIGLRSTASTSVTGIEETSLRALGKLEQVLPDRLRRRVSALQTHVEPLRWGSAQASVDPESLALLSQACRDGEQARFDYADKTGAETRRLVEPYRLVPTGRSWYLVAWDLRRDDWRTFRVDRISRPARAGGRALPRTLPAADAAEYVRQSLSAGKSGYDVAVVLDAPADEVARRTHRSGGTVEPIDDASCRLRLNGDSIEWMAYRIAMLDIDFTVEAPTELTDYLALLGERITRAAVS
jgi:predicted DNA-binding transcriptional regulator YafY